MIKSMQKKYLIDAFSHQKKDVGWDFYLERQFVENLFCQRFNYLIGIFAIIIAGAGSAKNQIFLISILIIGFIITFLLSLTLYRAYVKLIILLSILHKMDEKHVFPIVEKEIRAYGRKALFGVNQIIGIYLPLFFNVVLLLASILSILGILKA